MTPRLLVNPGTDDVAALVLLHAAAFADGWSAQSLRDLFATPGVFAFAAPEGFILVRAAGDEAEILTLAVVPAARRNGLGRALVRAALAHARTLGILNLFLEVGAGNDAAQRLYRGLGFVAVGRRKAYYGEEDADILRLPISRDFA